jgi:hypothetical protein
MDQIRVKKEREHDAILKQEKYHYFDTEQEANDFIRKRAQTEVRNAELALDKAIERSRKCYRKFPIFKIASPTAAVSDGGKK